MLLRRNMEIVYWNHCVYQIWYHQVFVVKYRKKLLIRDDHIQYLKEAIQEVCEKYNYVINEIGTDGDHVHLFVWAWWSESPSKIMWNIKGLTAKKMLKIPSINKKLWWWSFWSSWWYIGTIWEWTSEQVVRRYIKNQWLDENYLNRLEFTQL